MSSLKSNNIVQRNPSLQKVVQWLPFFLAGIFFLQAYFGNFQKSLTIDEPIFIASGYTYLTRNDFRLNSEAPPLLQQLVALPLLFLDLKDVPEDSPYWKNANSVLFDRQFFLLNNDKIPLISFWSRLPIIFIGIGLILTIATWGRQIYGTIPSLFATTVAAFSPNIIAHTKVATTDLGCSFFMFLAVYLFWRASKAEKIFDWVLCGFITGLALLSKYTALLLGPMYIVFTVMLLIRSPDKKTFKSLLLGNLILGSVALLIVGAGYNFSFNPFLYLEGLQNIYHNINQDYLFYLAGHISEDPWWFYYIAAFVMKVPLAILLILILALFSFARASQKFGTLLFVLFPALVIIGVSCFDKGNFGIRRILPAFPFLFMFTAVVIAENPQKIKTWLAVFLLVGLIIEAFLIFPHHLANFNVIAGGPEKGPYLLDDSNLDWGQDLPGLVAWQKDNPEEVPFKFYYYGNLPPSLYGVQAEMIGWRNLLRPQKGTYAVSAHFLTGLRKIQYMHGVDIDWLTKYEPTDRVGHSIYIYKFPQ